MNMRDLIPWGRQSSSTPVPYQEDERNPLMSFRRDIDRLFDDFLRGSWPSLGPGRSLVAWPNVEVGETDNEVRITAEVPGLDEKDVELTLQNGILTLRGEKKSETEDRDRGYSERYYGRFERRIALPDGIDEEHAKTDFRNGVLTVTLPKTESAERGRRIPINAETKH